MAELATIARPYAEALFKAVKADDAVTVAAEVNHLAAVVADPQLREVADNPKFSADQVFELAASVGGAGTALGDSARNLLRLVIENGRLPVLGHIAEQFQALVNARSGVFDAQITSAYPMDAAQLADVTASLERRFARKLNATVNVDSALIGGIRVVVGDEVLDTSVKARLEQMKAALTA